MTDGRFVLSDSGSVTISAENVQKLIRSRNGSAALLYLAILSRGGIYSRVEFARTLSMTPEKVDSAMDVLMGLGLVNDDTSPMESSDELPEYTAADINREIENGSAFRSLSLEVQSALGKYLSSDDLIKLFGIYDHLGLPSEVILLLVNHCVAEYSRRYGNTRRPTMRYIEKAAYQWERERIFTIEAAENYLARQERLDVETEAFAAALGIKGRALTATERRYISEWTAMGFAADAAAIAYDRTVVQTGKMSWGYMNSILKSWHSKNLHTPDEIEKGDRRVASCPQPVSAKPVKNLTAEAVARNRSALERLKGDK